MSRAPHARPRRALALAPGRLALASLVVLARPATVRADGEVAEMHASPHTETSDVLLGAKGAFVVEWIDRQAAEDEVRPGGGGGAYVELTLVPGWLELELGAVVGRSGDETILSFEPVLKKNFHVGPRTDLYLGIGPVLGVAIGPDDAAPILGGFTVIGLYVWLADWIGLDLELTGQLGWMRDPTVEVMVALGPVLRLG